MGNLLLTKEKWFFFYYEDIIFLKILEIKIIKFNLGSISKMENISIEFNFFIIKFEKKGKTKIQHIMHYF